MNVNPKLDLVLERVVDVTPALVWAAWTQPEHVKVLKERGEGHVERPCQLAHRGDAAAQALEDGAARRVGERAEDAIEGDGLVRHGPKYARML